MKILIFILFTLYSSASFTLAQVSLEIGNGILVEADDSVYIELDGNLIESGSGYLSGKIYSGVRTGMTLFAGLTLGSAMNGSIARTCSSEYSKGNGEGTNLLRYYEINNTGGLLSCSFSANCILSGNHDERNGLTGPYFIYRYTTDWAAYGSGSISAPIACVAADIPSGISDWLFSEGVRVASRIFLEGPYDDQSDQMTTNLNSSIPASSPYPEDNRSVVSVPSGVTDWVLVQLRETASGSALGSRSCFINADGYLVADDGSTNFVGVRTMPGNYYLVLKHRNHLAVMNSAPILSGLTWGVTPSVYNFTTSSSQFFDTGSAKEIESGVWGMYSGDTDASGVIDAADRSNAWNQRNLTGYYNEDVELNGVVDAGDRSITWNNRNITSPIGKSTKIQTKNKEEIK